MFYKHCIFGKQCRQKFKAGKHVSKGVLDYIHSGLWGLSPTIFYGEETYYVLFIDDFLRKFWVYVLKRNTYVFNTFKQIRVMVEKELEGK